MLTALRDSRYYSKVARCGMEAFGIDFNKMCGIYKDLMPAIISGRKAGQSVQEAVTIGLALTISYLSSKAEYKEGDSVDYIKIGTYAVIIDGWVAQGLVRPSFRNIFLESIDIADDRASRSSRH